MARTHTRYRKKPLLLIIHLVVPHPVSSISHTRSNNIDLSQNNAFITLMTTQFSHRISSCSILFNTYIYIYIVINGFLRIFIKCQSKFNIFIELRTYVKIEHSANEIPIHSNPLDAMTYAHLVFAFFDTFQVHSGNNSCSRYSTVFVLKKKKESLFFLNCAR